MKKTKSAVKYGMETLKLSPDDLFKLIESSRGYSGDDYSRWLASKIIEIAEADGVQFSQLLVKKFNIINELLEEVSENQVIRSEFLDIFEGCLYFDTFSVDFENLGKSIDIDWYSGLDLDSENSFFVKEVLPLELQNKILEDEKVSLFFRLSLDVASKKTDLYTDAKGQGLLLGSKGAMILYRLCSMVRAFELTNLKVGLLVPVKFLYDVENESIIDYTLQHFKIIDGFSIKSVELSSDAFNAGDMAFVTLVPREFEDVEQDGVELVSITLDENEALGYSELCSKRYSKSCQPMLNKISDSSPLLVEDVPMQSVGKVSGLGKGLENALGYLNINGSISLTTLPEEGKKNIAITKDNIKDIIAYYGVTVSREVEWGYSSDIPCLIDGRAGYEELLYNCLPLFLFDYNVGFKNFGSINLGDDSFIINNKLDVLKSEVVQELLDVGMPYFTFEAKELFNLCKDYIVYTEENLGISGKSFQELRELSDNKDFNNMYDMKLANLKDLIYTLSKKFM